jgi:hypothetical protein
MSDGAFDSTLDGTSDGEVDGILDGTPDRILDGASAEELDGTVDGPWYTSLSTGTRGGAKGSTRRYSPWKIGSTQWESPSSQSI